MRRIRALNALLAATGGGGAPRHLSPQSDRTPPSTLVDVDATPDAIAQERAVKAGFAVSSVAASVLKASAPLGILRLLVRTGAMPLYPEQRRYRQPRAGE